MKSKYIIFDAGPIINFAMNNMLGLLSKLKKEFSGDFLITKEVKFEIIDNPLNIKKFEFEALQIKELFEKGIIKHANITNNQVNRLRVIREEILQKSNSLFSFKGENIHLIDKGEAASLALSVILDESIENSDNYVTSKSEFSNKTISKKGDLIKKIVYNIIVIDERTTRMLCESPENLKELLEKKLHSSVVSKNSKNENYNYFSKFKIIRSTELVYLAHKKRLIELKDKRAYEAMLYALKFHGCSISMEEIEEMKLL